MNRLWPGVVALVLSVAWVVDALTLNSIVGRWVLPPLTLVLLFYLIFRRPPSERSDSPR